MKHETWNMEHETWNMEHGTWNMEHGTWNMEHGTWNNNPLNSHPDPFDILILIFVRPCCRQTGNRRGKSKNRLFNNFCKEYTIFFK